MLTSEDKTEIRKMIKEESSRDLRAELLRLIPEIFGRSIVQLKVFFGREIT